ncbi:MAG: alpha amylase C-terminal domain-containing protein, partial [Paraprevotella sp.]|nr:alpha amylase C-terminal domain-containing protein [Paraprevotella sp.]
FMVPKGTYEVILDTDAVAFGGHGLNDDSVRHVTTYDPLLEKDGKGWLKLYLPARSALVLRRVKEDAGAK